MHKLITTCLYVSVPSRWLSVQVIQKLSIPAAGCSCQDQNTGEALLDRRDELYQPKKCIAIILIEEYLPSPSLYATLKINNYSCKHVYTLVSCQGPLSWHRLPQYIGNVSLFYMIFLSLQHKKPLNVYLRKL